MIRPVYPDAAQRRRARHRRRLPGRDRRWVLSMDCDFQHLLAGGARPLRLRGRGHDVVVGSRFSRHSVLLNYPFQKIVANRASTSLAQLVLRTVPRPDQQPEADAPRGRRAAAASGSRGSRSTPRRGSSRCSWAIMSRRCRSPGSTGPPTWGRLRSDCSGSGAATGGCLDAAGHATRLQACGSPRGAPR